MSNFLLILDESPKIRRAPEGWLIQTTQMEVFTEKTPAVQRKNHSVRAPKDAEKWLRASAYQVPEQARMEWSSEQLLGRSCTHILWIWWEVTTP